MHRRVKTKAEKARIATISAHNDTTVVALVANAVERLVTMA
jgi:chaperonin GroEL